MRLLDTVMNTAIVALSLQAFLPRAHRLRWRRSYSGWLQRWLELVELPATGGGQGGGSPEITAVVHPMRCRKLMLSAGLLAVAAVLADYGFGCGSCAVAVVATIARAFLECGAYILKTGVQMSAHFAGP